MHPRCTALLLGSLAFLGSSVALAEASTQTPPEPSSPATAATQELRHTNNYTITSAPTKSLLRPPPKLPDITGYTHGAVLEKLEKPGSRVGRGRASLQRMLKQDTLKEFTGGDERMRVWLSRQREMPQAIFITGGYITPRELAKQVPKRYFEETSDGVFVARLPIVIGHDSILHQDVSVKDLRLSQ